MATPQIISSGPKSLSRPFASTSRFSRRYAARKTISISFAISPGWNCSGPTRTQRRAPLIVVPITGNAGSSSSTIDPRPSRYL